MNRRWLLPLAIMVALVQIGVLVWSISARAYILRTGQEVMLTVQPIDPRDLLRGDYVILGYNISRVPAELFAERPGGTERADERPVFVRLREGEDGIWQAVAARYGERPAQPAADGEIDIKGTARAVWFDNTRFVTVRYGIERFYVPEGEGRAIERDMRERQFQMKIAVAESGAAQIKAFYDGENMLYAEPLY